MKAGYRHFSRLATRLNSLILEIEIRERDCARTSPSKDQLLFKDSLAASYRWAQGRIMDSHPSPWTTRKYSAGAYADTSPRTNRGVHRDKKGGGVIMWMFAVDCL